MLDFLKDHSYGRRSVRWMTSYAVRNYEFPCVLDVGVGEAQDLMYVKRIRPHASLYAIESHDKLRACIESKGVCVEVRDIEQDVLPYNDNSMHLIILNQVLEHCKNTFWILHEVSRVLRDDGYLIIGVPNLASLSNRLQLLFGVQPSSIDNTSMHIRGFTKDSLVDFVQIANCYRLDMFLGTGVRPLPSFLGKIPAALFPTISTSIHLMFHKDLVYCNDYMKYLEMRKFQTNFKETQCE